MRTAILVAAAVGFAVSLLVFASVGACGAETNALPSRLTVGVVQMALRQTIADKLTRYDQLSAASPFHPGANPGAMWFRVKGVPAVVTIGQDALWTELAEVAAVAGAQVHVHLDRDPANDPDAALRRLQVWSNLASFQTFSATVNVAGSAIWDDLRDLEERRAEVRGQPRPNTGPVEVYSPFSANLVVRAGAGPQLIVATRRVGPINPYHPLRTSNLNPQMDAWYRLGAAIIQPSKRNEP